MLKFECDTINIKFDPPLTEEESKFVDSIITIGQHIKDQESLIKILRHTFFGANQ